MLVWVVTIARARGPAAAIAIAIGVLGCSRSNPVFELGGGGATEGVATTGVETTGDDGPDDGPVGSSGGVGSSEGPAMCRDEDCPPGERCEAGMCRAPCDTGEIKCDGDCTDVQSDPAHCGECNFECGPLMLCGMGDCVGECPLGWEECGGGCVDLDNDHNNCGDCNFMCDEAVGCFGGECLCPNSEIQCGDACVDTTSDALNCGKCGMVCQSTMPVADLCVDMECQCVPGETPCEGLCTDTQWDPLNCGGCTDPKDPTGETECAADSEVCIAGDCVDLLFDGACDTEECQTVSFGECCESPIVGNVCVEPNSCSA